jgi:hypothetical protein
VGYEGQAERNGTLVYIKSVQVGNSVCTLILVKVKFTLEQAMKAQRGSRDIALLFH